MKGFYELICLDCCGFDTYYYFYSPRAIRNPKMALNYGYAPDGMRLIVYDKEECPLTIRPVNIFEYFYKKYFKKAGTFRWGYRVNWEKEIKEYLK